MFERFTDRARRVVVLAQEEARMLNHNYIGTEHILLGLIHEGEGVAAKALESLGINWKGTLPIPKTNAERFPEVKKLVDQGLQSVQYTFSADNQSEAGKLYRGASPSNDGTELSTALMPDGVPITIAPERREEFSPGLDPELLALIQATAEVELKAADRPGE